MSTQNKFTHWQRTETQFLAADPKAVYSIVGNLSQTGEWMKSFDGFVVHDDQRGVGTRVDLLAPGKLFGPLHRSTAPSGSITRRNHQTRMVEFTQPQPGGSMILRWQVDEHEGGALLHFTVELSGPGTTAFKFTVANTLCQDFAVAAARLYKIIAPTAHRKRDARVVISGGRGFLGRNLAADLTCRGITVAVLTRNAEEDFPAEQFIWDGVHQGPWTSVLRSDYPVHLINLAGERVDKRNTPSNIAALTDSRVTSTQTLAHAAAAAPQLATWIQASTTAIFGDGGEADFTESSPLPTDRRALPEMTGVASAWEQAFDEAKVNAEQRYVLRTSLVMHPDAPLLGPLNMLVNTGLGGPMGDGQQWFSWIGLQDWLHVIRCMLGFETPHIPAGLVHATCPTPLRNKEVMAALRSVTGLPGIPTGSVLPKIGAAVMGSNARVALTGRKVTSEVLSKAGFEFHDTDFATTISG
ncbi:NAD-dependent epimerase/dehydratase family protein [Glutamicibacter sp. JC586]|uniref:NAD-dependent epimerase/dehydratase family protein n=1 Tax=Glutamicibacter sp. JC586 TaxID=2590552 RepID=UPI0013570B43|nr:NAD-dependent epimerase/dehydratase family protein [Glutamicibacter sp. JC586]